MTYKTLPQVKIKVIIKGEKGYISEKTQHLDKKQQETGDIT